MSTKTTKLQMGASALERWIDRGLYDSFGLFLAGVAIVLLGAVFWAVSAALTVAWVGQFTVPIIPTKGAEAWSIPFAMSVIEVFTLGHLKGPVRTSLL